MRIKTLTTKYGNIWCGTCARWERHVSMSVHWAIKQLWWLWLHLYLLSAVADWAQMAAVRQAKRRQRKTIKNAQQTCLTLVSTNANGWAPCWFEISHKKEPQNVPFETSSTSAFPCLWIVTDVLYCSSSCWGCPKSCNFLLWRTGCYTKFLNSLAVSQRLANHKDIKLMVYLLKALQVYWAENMCSEELFCTWCNHTGLMFQWEILDWVTQCKHYYYVIISKQSSDTTTTLLHYHTDIKNVIVRVATCFNSSHRIQRVSDFTQIVFLSLGL